MLNVDSKYLTIPSTYQQLHFVHAINGINKTTFINTDISSVKIVVSILLAVLEYVLVLVQIISYRRGDIPLKKCNRSLRC